MQGKTKDWDYYTLLWSKEKTQDFRQESFGFKFDDISRYLDKSISYLDVIYKEIINMIYEYKKETSQKKITKNENPIEQLNILEKEDKERLNSRYKHIINDIKVLIKTQITDKLNEKRYQKYKNKLIENIPVLYNTIQYPERNNSINEIENVIDCDIEYFTNTSSYYYSKLYEYWNNEDMEDLLIEHFKDRIPPFNNNISNIKELYCLVKAYNYYRIIEKAQ